MVHLPSEKIQDWAGWVVLEEVPPNCTVVGVPGRVVKMNDERKIPRLEYGSGASAGSDFK